MFEVWSPESPDLTHLIAEAAPGAVGLPVDHPLPERVLGQAAQLSGDHLESIRQAIDHLLRQARRRLPGW